MLLDATPPITVQRFEKIIGGMWGRGGLFQKAPTQIFEARGTPPGSVHGSGTGREGDRCSAGRLLGLSREEFQGQAAVPWNETGSWGLLKETPTALTILFPKR